MTPLFLDTGFLIALESVDDQYHTRAITFWETFQSAPAPLVTTSYVLDEVATFFNNRRRHAKAVEIGQQLLTSPSVQFIHIDEALFEEGWKFFQRHHDKRYSLTDCISFAVMKHLKLKTALSFDRHFVQAGFQVKP